LTDEGTAVAKWKPSEVRPIQIGSGIPSKEHIMGMLDLAPKLLFYEDINQLCEGMATMVGRLFSASQVVVWMIDPDGKHRPKAAIGCTPEALNEMMSLSHEDDYDAETIKVANRISPLSVFVPAELGRYIGHDAKHLESLSSSAEKSKPRETVDQWHDMDYLKVGILSRDGRPLGSFVISGTTDGKIPSLETVKAMEVFSSICTVATIQIMQRQKKAAIADAAAGHSDRLSQILSFAREVLTIESPEKVFESVLRIMKDLFGFQSGTISLLDEKEDCFRYVALMGYAKDDMEYAKTIHVPPDSHQFFVQPEFMIGRNAYYVPAENLPDQQLIWEIYSPEDFSEIKAKKSTPRPFPGAWHHQDNLLYPIHDKRGRVMGLLCPDNPLDGLIPSLETIEGMGVFTSLVSIALENAKYYSEIIRAKGEIEILNGLLFRDVSKINADIREYLEETMSPDFPPDQRARAIKNAIQMLDSIMDLIQKVRKISSIRSMSSSDLLKLDLVSVLRNQSSRVVAQYSDKKVKESFGNMPSNCYILANDLVGELFGNIIRNAIVHNYSEDPEMIISVEALSDEFSGKTFWDVSISDNGSGIAEERKTAIFDLNSQIINSIGRTGVSLSMVKSIVTLYNGSVWVENRVPSDYRRGSVFHVLLPAA
jgi:hypothetical protein